MWDVVIAVALALLAAIATYLGVYLTLHPPGEEEKQKKRSYKLTFLIIGGLSVVLIFVQAYRAHNSSDEIDRLLGEIKKNTEQPPQVIVNVPPSTPPNVIVNPPQQAQAFSHGFMQLSKVQFVNPSKFEANSAITANVFLANKGTEPVEEFERYYATAIGTSIDPTKLDAMDRSAHDEFRKEVKKAILKNPKSHMTVGVGDQPWNTLITPASQLTQETADNLRSGKSRYYIYVWARWKNGKHDLDLCEGLQQPSNSDLATIPPGDLVWHVCFE
jgi:hypothetical protein